MSEIRQFEGILTYVDADGNELEMYPEVKTDTTLSVSGKPADAKAVGEKLKNIDGGGNAKAVTISREEFEALSEEEKNSGIYVIPDGDDLTAKNLFYDGSLTGLGNNVQDAVDNINNNMVRYNSETDKLDVYVNGEYVGSLPCNFQAYYLFNKTFLSDGITGFTEKENLQSTFTEKDDYLEINSVFTYGVSAGRIRLLSNSIDVTKYTKLTMKGSVSQTNVSGATAGNVTVYIGDNTYNRTDMMLTKITNESIVDITVPIDNLIGLQQIIVYLNASNPTSGSNTATFKLQEIYLHN